MKNHPNFNPDDEESRPLRAATLAGSWGQFAQQVG
jgi:hypothetical protein